MTESYALPHGVKLKYLAEGGANVIFRATLPATDQDGNSTPPPTEVSPPSSPSEVNQIPQDILRTHLIRLRKDVPWLLSTAAQHETYTTLVRPLFQPGELLSQYLVRMPFSLMTTANELLHEAESTGARPVNRRGVYLATAEQHGLLIEDMTSTSRMHVMTVELKPKWLAQSPNAPRDAVRCRTCALRTMRTSQSLQQKPRHGICPLNLVSGDLNDVSQAIECLLDDFTDSNVKTRERLTRYFLESDILLRLKELQMQLDSKGILSFDKHHEPSERFGLAMTLRDCTLYLRLRRTQNVGGDEFAVEGKLGDLDVKLPEPSKVAYWKNVERDLCAGGWYSVTNQYLEHDRRRLCRLLPLL